MDFISTNVCQRCGAGPQNAYEHHDFCLINLPKDPNNDTHTNQSITDWKRGKHDAERGTSRHKPGEASQAYIFGWNFQQAKMSSDSTITSISQAIGMAKGAVAGLGSA